MIIKIADRKCEKKVSPKVTEIENEESENRGTRPPTAVTTERIMFILGLNTSRRNRLRGSEAIFAFHS